MADAADEASDTEELERKLGLRASSKAVEDMAVGAPGECVACGFDFTRVVDGHCGRCRDELGLP